MLFLEFPNLFYRIYFSGLKSYICGMKIIAQVILENPNGEVLMYLRDNNPNIPFPHHWDLIGGHVEENETVEQGLVRETKEELGIQLIGFKFWRSYVCLEGDVYPNIKYIFKAPINLSIEEITLLEGERVQYFKLEEIEGLKLANIFGTIMGDYVKEKNR